MIIYIARPALRAEHARHVCNLCGAPSEDTICEACSNKVRAEALDRKRREDRGEAC